MQLREVVGPLDPLGTAGCLQGLAGTVEDSREAVGNWGFAGIAAQQKPFARTAVQVRVVEAQSIASLTETAAAVQESLQAVLDRKAVPEGEPEELEETGDETLFVDLPSRL